MLIRKDVTKRFHEQFEVLCGLHQKIEDDFMTKIEVLCGLEKISEIMIS
jgi:hypothetical protein